MRLGFHYHVPAIKRDGVISMPGYLGLFIDGLAEYCESLTCFMHSPLPGENEFLDYRIGADNVSLVDIGLHNSVPTRILSSGKTRSVIKAALSGLDLMLVRAPTPLIHLFGSGFNLPVAMFIVGDNVKGCAQMNQPWWRKAIISLLWRWNHSRQMKIARNNLVFVNSESMYEELRSVVKEIAVVKSSTISRKNFYLRDDTCQGEQVVLLYVGRYEYSKGLFELYSALSMLKKRGRNFRLHLVGWPGKKDLILEELAGEAKRLGISDLITDFGYRGMGEELFETYKKADIFVIPTKFDSFPRTITEAMAHSLPVIATNVGGIPHRLTDGVNAILVEPGECDALADAINRVASDKKLRQELIMNGRKLASKNTLEIQSEKMIDELERFLKEYDK